MQSQLNPQMLSSAQQHVTTLESKISHEHNLKILKEKLINIWNTVQPESENQMYDKVFTLEHPYLSSDKYNPYHLSYKEHECLITTLSILIQIADDILPSFKSTPYPEGWIPLDNRHQVTNFKLIIHTKNNTISNIIPLHVELIRSNYIGDKRAVSIMNGLLTLFIESYTNVMQAGETSVKKFCNLLIPADDNHACVDARTRMAINFGLSNELLKESFTDILEKASQACGENTSFYAIICILMQKYWGTSFKEDVGTNAICTVSDYKKYHGKLNYESYPLIKKGIETILQETPHADFMLVHKNIINVNQKFEFFRMVLKEPSCIKLLEEIEEAKDDKKNWQQSFDELMLTQNPNNGKTILGFSIEDCRATNETINILIENISNENFKAAIIQAGIVWKGDIKDKVVSRLKAEDNEWLAQVIALSSLDDPLHSLDDFMQEAEDYNDKLNIVFLNTQYYCRLLRESDDVANIIKQLNNHIKVPDLLKLIHYSGIIKSYIELAHSEENIKINNILHLFNEEMEYSKSEQKYFDALMETYSTTRDSNLFGILVAYYGVKVPMLIKNMSPLGVERVFKDARLAWDYKDLEKVLSKVDIISAKRMLFSASCNDILIYDKNLRSGFTNNLKVIANKLSVRDWLALLAHHNILALGAESADLFEFFLREIKHNLSHEHAGLFLSFIYHNSYIPEINSKNDINNIIKIKAIIRTIVDILRKSILSLEEKNILVKILNTSIPNNDTNLFGFLEIHCDNMITNNSALILNIPPSDLFECAIRANVCWGSSALDAMLSTFFDCKAIKNFLLVSNQLFNNANNFLYFQENLAVIAKHLSREDLLEILLHYQDRFLLFAQTPENLANFVSLVKKTNYFDRDNVTLWLISLNMYEKEEKEEKKEKDEKKQTDEKKETEVTADAKRLEESLRGFIQSQLTRLNVNDQKYQSLIIIQEKLNDPNNNINTLIAETRNIVNIPKYTNFIGCSIYNYFHPPRSAVEFNKVFDEANKLKLFVK